MPKDWVEKNNLKKGDLISIDNDGVELILRANQQEQKQDSKECSIEVQGSDIELTKAEIVSSYLNGYDTINILFDKAYKNAPKIKDIIRNLSGLEIMEQTSTRIVAKNLININEISIKNIIRRMDIITRAMIEDAILCYKGHPLYDSIQNRDIDVNRLYFLSYRVIKNALKNPRIAKLLGIEPWHLHSDTLVILRLEKIADRQKRIARYLCTSHFNRATLSELELLHIEIADTYNNAMKSYYNQERETAFQIEVTNKDRIASYDKFLEKYTNVHACIKGKTTNSNLIAVAQIIENLKATAASIKNIARTVLCYE